MTDKQIQRLIASGPLLPLKQLMKMSEDFVRGLSMYSFRKQEVGAVRRGDKQGRVIEILLTLPARSRRGRLINNLKYRYENLDLSMKDIWMMTLCDIPFIIYFASSEKFVARQLITTGPEDFMQQVQMAAKAKGFRLDHDGFYRGDRLIVPFDEAEILEEIGLPYVPPQKRAAYAKELRERQS